MKSLRNILMVGFLLSLASMSAHAQIPAASKLTVTIPFNFSVGERNFAAGEYAVRRIYDSGLCYSIRRTDKQPTDYPAQATFIVTRVHTGQRQVWGVGKGVGGELLRAARERKVAQAGERTEIVTLVARQ
jgi:hypothetical protein